MEEYVIWDQKKINLENFTLILPSLSVGNVGQLAVDLLINNLNVKNVAHIHHFGLLPFIGADPFDQKQMKLTTSCQLYVCEDKKIAIIQQRSPIILSERPDYISFLIRFFKEHNFSRTILLCSSFSQFFTIDDLRGVPAHFLSSSSFSDTETLVNLQWKKFALHPKINPKETSSIPGGGIAKFLLEDCEKEGIPFVILILVCSEGNNYPEAFQMVERLNDWLNLKQKDDSSNWKMPMSWTSPYGNDAPKTLY